MKLRLHTFTLPLRHVFTISRDSRREQPTLVVELEEDGIRGYGEATATVYYGVSLAAMSEALEGVRRIVESTALSTPEALWDLCASQLSRMPFAQCALDEAAHDLWGKKHNKRVYEMWGLQADNLPLSNYTIGMASIDVMVQKLREFPDWPIYKIKLGREDDLRAVEALRAETQAIFRVDANGAWTAAETLEKAPRLAELGVELIEQPLPMEAMEPMRRLRDASPLPLIADESCQGEADVARCAAGFHGINIKLVKCGGLTPARRMIAEARRLGLKTMVGCMTESTVGISAIAQLLPLLDYVDMDGAALLAQDIATGVRVERGRAIFPPTPGCGVTLL